MTYPEDSVRVNQYIVLDENNISVYRTWIHDYTLNSIKPVLEKAGFKIVQHGMTLPELLTKKEETG